MPAGPGSPANRLLICQDNGSSDQEQEKLRNQKSNLAFSSKNECANWRECKCDSQREKSALQSGIKPGNLGEKDSRGGWSSLRLNKVRGEPFEEMFQCPLLENRRHTGQGR